MRRPIHHIFTIKSPFLPRLGLTITQNNYNPAAVPRKHRPLGANIQGQRGLPQVRHHVELNGRQLRASWLTSCTRFFHFIFLCLHFLRCDDTMDCDSNSEYFGFSSTSAIVALQPFLYLQDIWHAHFRPEAGALERSQCRTGNSAKNAWHVAAGWYASHSAWAFRAWHATRQPTTFAFHPTRAATKDATWSVPFPMGRSLANCFEIKND